MALSGLLVDTEDLLYVRAEVAGERDGERQRGRVALLLDRVDRLAGDGHRLAELLLGQAALGPQLLDTVVHRGGCKGSFTSPRCQASFTSQDSPCSSAPLTAASSAFRRYSASASGEPKRPPGAAVAPWWVSTQWASASRRGSSIPAERSSIIRWPRTTWPRRRPSSDSPISAP